MSIHIMEAAHSVSPVPVAHSFDLLSYVRPYINFLLRIDNLSCSLLIVDAIKISSICTRTGAKTKGGSHSGVNYEGVRH